MEATDDGQVSEAVKVNVIDEEDDDLKIVQDDQPDDSSGSGSGSDGGDGSREMVKVYQREIAGFGFLINPVVLLIGMGILWTVIILMATASEESAETYSTGKSKIAQMYTWFYILSQDAWVIVLIAVYFKFGHIKLGTPDSKPEFDAATYFMMIFSAGIGTGLFVYALEPLDHSLTSYPNRYSFSATTRDELDQQAMNLTLFHWGPLGWITYSLLAIAMALMKYRHGLPLSIRAALFPLLGRHTWGWIGDLIDGVSVVTLMAGVVTSLSFAAIQVNDGFVSVGLIEGEVTANQKHLVIWIITAVASVSVFSGLHVGIKTLSQVGFLLGTLIWAMVLFADNTPFLLNVAVQTFGYHFQHFIELGFHTDAYGQLNPGQGRALDEKSPNSGWMDGWTIFYWAWWIAWAPFVSMFLARISRGRTIANVTHYTMAVPLIYSLLWFAVFGGAGQRMERRAEELEAAGFEPMIIENSTAICFEVPEFLNFTGELIPNPDALLSPVCKMAAFQTGAHWFVVLAQYQGIGDLLKVLSLFAMSIYFVTSSDSGSLVVDTLTANGGESKNPLQRVFWAITQGAFASAVVASGAPVTVIQHFTVIAGLPYTVVICLISVALWKALSNDEFLVKHGAAKFMDIMDEPHHHFNFPIYGGVLDIFELVLSGFSVSSAKKRGFKSNPFQYVVPFLFSLGLPFVQLARIQAHVFPSQKMAGLVNVISSGIALGVAVVLILAKLASDEANFFLEMCTVAYLIFALIVARVRFLFRQKYGITHGNFFEDFFATLFFYPQVLCQMTDHMSAHDRLKAN